jgi:uroporphyrinogen-III synthase
MILSWLWKPIVFIRVVLVIVLLFHHRVMICHYHHHHHSSGIIITTKITTTVSSYRMISYPFLSRRQLQFHQQHKRKNRKMTFLREFQSKTDRRRTTHQVHHTWKSWDVASSIRLSSSSSSSSASSTSSTITTDETNNVHDTIVNITILLTRELGKNEKLRQAIHQKWDTDHTIIHSDTNRHNVSYRIHTMEVPCIEHAHGEDYHMLRTTILQHHWDYIIVTSPEAATMLLSQWPYHHDEDDDRNDSGGDTSYRIAAVGTATEQTLRHGGMEVDFVPSKATAHTLVQEIPWISIRPSTSSSSSSSDPLICQILYPASARAEHTIQHGLEVKRKERNATELFHVQRLNTYDTITSTWNKEQQEQVLSWLQHSSSSSSSSSSSWIEEQQQQQQQHDPNHHHVIVTVASPSSIKGWLSNTNHYTNVSVACIGETSQKACLKYGWENQSVYYPDQPGIDGWMKSIEDAIHDIIQPYTNNSTNT